MYQPLIAMDAQLQYLDWTQAQPWCNFVLMSPEILPYDMCIIERQLRPESGRGNRSTYRCVIGNKTRKISIKQFLYDWAPPAYDHPNLWRNAEISSINDTPTSQPYVVGNNVAWIGLNYRRQQAASLNIMRTSVEITAVEGCFSTEEFLEIYKGLRPVDPNLMKQIINSSFAALSYPYRHCTVTSPVPLSYWQYTRQDDITMHAYSWNQAPDHILKEHTQWLPPLHYSPNSIFTFGDPESPIEIEYYYEHQDCPGCYIRVLTTPRSYKYAIPFPPKLGDQSCNSCIVDIKGTKVFHASLTEMFGPHEAIWQQGEHNFLLLTKPAPWTDGEWFFKVLHSLIKGKLGTK